MSDVLYWTVHSANAVEEGVVREKEALVDADVANTTIVLGHMKIYADHEASGKTPSLLGGA